MKTNYLRQKEIKTSSCKNTVLSLLLIIGIMLSLNSIAQAPEPPSGGHGQTGNQSGGNAPIGSGLFMLLAMGTIYGIKKAKSIHKKISDTN